LERLNRRISATANQGRGSGPLRFVGLSGLGWLIDMAVYTVLVGSGVRVLSASILGGVCGASFSFLTSRRLVFRSSARGVWIRLAFYLAYTVGLIILAGAVTEWLTQLLVGVAAGLGYQPSFTVLAVIAKCLITPFLLLSNFLVARSMLAGR
jgi:putative flippase GtrA